MAPTAAAIASPISSSAAARSFRSSCPTLDPSRHRCHRRAPPLCSIVTGSDLRPTVPSPPSSALLLLPQPLLANYLTPTSSSFLAAVFSAFYGLFPLLAARRSQLSPPP
ncbi:hypothetical protein BHE74_00031316 [Ensete ventricosum]|nr:hypothetical protein GW17_00035577 [Ensete ventricosum]RWW61621.1 hypothetical protein BHE74_00031316 [Ensete ventricosum]RZS04908.1 hypothetical protein BHM03_00035308 [Ensete ventricosum]